MFVTKKKYQTLVKSHNVFVYHTETDINRLQKRVDYLEQDIELLKQYLRIEKEYTPAKTKYVQKTPEQSEESH